MLQVVLPLMLQVVLTGCFVDVTGCFVVDVTGCFAVDSEVLSGGRWRTLFGRVATFEGGRLFASSRSIRSKASCSVFRTIIS